MVERLTEEGGEVSDARKRRGGVDVIVLASDKRAGARPAPVFGPIDQPRAQRIERSAATRCCSF